MLKIKDDLDLKDLEILGFKKKEYFIDTFEYEYWGVRIDCQTRRIGLLPDAVIEILYDLIKADLVEKVGEIDE